MCAASYAGFAREIWRWARQFDGTKAGGRGWWGRVSELQGVSELWGPAGGGVGGIGGEVLRLRENASRLLGGPVSGGARRRASGLRAGGPMESGGRAAGV